MKSKSIKVSDSEDWKSYTGSFLSKPEILILDEPFSNLNPSSQSWLKSKLKALSNEGDIYGEAYKRM